VRYRVHEFGPGQRDLVNAGWCAFPSGRPGGSRLSPTKAVFVANRTRIAAAVAKLAAVPSTGTGASC